MRDNSSAGGLNRRTAVILKALYYLNNKQRLVLLKSADRSLIKAICECILNIITGNVNISHENRKRLYKYKNFLRKLASPNKKRSWQQRKRIIVQKGSGFLPLIIPPVMSILLSKLLEKNG